MPRLIPEWKEAYKWFSVHGAMIVTAASSTYAYADAFRSFVPPQVYGYLMAALGLTIIVGRVVQQGAKE